jgi:hypothetical protein
MGSITKYFPGGVKSAQKKVIVVDIEDQSESESQSESSTQDYTSDEFFSQSDDLGISPQLKFKTHQEL